jgi:hypothetical protein
MNRVNSFIAGGAALQEDYDLIPIMERIGIKGTGGAMRPHIKAERNVYNGRMVYHVLNAKGQVKHTASDKWAAKKHLAQKYQSYMNEGALSEVSLGDYKEKASQQVKELKPFVKGEYGDIAKRAIERRTKGLKMAMKREEVEQIDEISTDGYHKAAIKSRMNAAVDVASSMGSDKQARTKLDARNRGLKRLSDRTSAEMKKANSGPQRQSVGKEPTEAERRGYGQGRYMGDSVEHDDEVMVEGYYNDIGPEYGGAGKGRSEDAMMTAKLTRQAKAAAKKAGKTFNTSAEYRLWHKKQKPKKAVKEEVEIEEGMQQTLRKYVPGYAKRQIDNKMDAEKFGKRDVDRDANFHRYKKIQDKMKKQVVSEAQSAAVRWQKALEAAKKKREEEAARNAENAKRALTPQDNK